MRKLAKAVVALVGLVALLVGVGWLGLQVKPKPFPPHPERTPELDTSELPSDLPTPVSRYIRLTMGEKVPRIDTAVVWARGEFNFNGLVWFPMRLKSYHVAGREFRRDMELTWFGMPIFRGTDSYIDGKGTLKFTGLFGLLNVSDEGGKIDQGDNLVMWAEAPFTTPSALVLEDPQRVRWEPIDEHTARLIFPFEQKQESLRVEFDPQSGMIRSMSGMRHRGQEERRSPFRSEYAQWRTLRGMEVPHRDTATWEDWGEPYIIVDLDGAEYNVDVSEKIP